MSSSIAACELFLFDELKDKYGYTTPQECFEDRVNHRQEWYERICEYNKTDRAKLTKYILSKSDIYVGMRDKEEIEECIRQSLFDIIIWVDASERLPKEAGTSNNVGVEYAHFIVPNNGTLDEFIEKSLAIGNILSKAKRRELAPSEEVQA